MRALPRRSPKAITRTPGLDVTLVQGNGSGNTAQLVANGRAQLAYADAVAVSQLIAKGAPMKVVATIYQSNPNAVMALKKTGIKSVKDLAGKKVGVPSGSSQTTMLPLLLKSNNLKESDINDDRHAGRVDGAGAAAGPGRRGARLDRRLSDPGRGAGRAARRLPLRRLRRADGEHVDLREQRATSRNNPDVVKKFIAASLKGWSFALDNPDKAIKDLKVVFPEVNEKLAAAELAAITPLFCSGGAKYVGKAEDALWAKSQDLLVGGQAAARRPGSEDVLHERLPAAGIGDARVQVVIARRERHGARTMASERRQGYTYADLHVGMSFRSPGRTITDADLVAFAGLTGDYSELHTSDVYAKNSQFGRRVAHGMLGLAYAHGLMWARTGELRETAIAFLGIDEWKFAAADLHRRHDLRQLPDRRAARQQVEADAGDRDVRRRGRQPGRARRAARAQGAARVQGAARRRRGVRRASPNESRHADDRCGHVATRSAACRSASAACRRCSAKTPTSRSSR